MHPLRRLWQLIYRAERIAFREGVYTDTYVQAAKFAFGYAEGLEELGTSAEEADLVAWGKMYLPMRQAAYEVRYALKWGAK